MEAISLVRGHVYGINGDQRDVIDEDEFVNGLHSIRIGGDKLSRGLTLPGLMTSYFLRVSRMYDTLMQMGRWFGYRDKYQDICQIYTTGLLFNWFGHVANASESLRSRIIEMNSMDLSPLDYQQRIQSHPGRMLVTALNKQRHTKPIAISFAGTLAQLTSFALDEEGVRQNEENSRKVSALMESLKSSDLSRVDEKGARIFHDVDFEIAADFVERFEHTREAGIWNGRALAGYIRNMASKGELTNWTIAFQHSTKANPGTETRTIGDWNMTSNFRSGKRTEFDIFTMSNSSLVSINHEKFDFPKDARAALKTRDEIKSSRPETRGLLIVYFVTAAQKNPERILGCVPALGISFPQTENAEKVTFVASVGDNVPDFRDDDFV